MGIRLSDMHLVYSLANVFDMVYSPGFNVSMFSIWLLPVAVPYVIFRSGASSSNDVISGTWGQCGLWYSFHCRLAWYIILIFVI